MLILYDFSRMYFNNHYFSSTRDVKNAPVKCLAWHPHVAKLALAMKDDTVQVVLNSSNIKPLLKHKKQKQVADTYN